MCPMDKNIEERIWYPDEDICGVHKFCKDKYIKLQRKIKKKVRNRDLYFTFDMLNRNITIVRGTKGLSPNDKVKEQEEKWIEKHKDRKKKVLSAERIDELKKNLIKARNSKSL